MAVAVAQLKSCITKLEATYLGKPDFLIRFPTQNEIDGLSMLIQKLRKLLGGKKTGGVFMGRNARAVDKRFKKLELYAFIKKLCDRVLAGGYSPITRLRKQIANDPAREIFRILLDIVEMGPRDECLDAMLPWETAYDGTSGYASMTFQDLVATLSPASDAELKRLIGFAAIGDLMIRQHQWQLDVEPAIRPSIHWLESLQDGYNFPELHWFLERGLLTPEETKKQLIKYHARLRQQKCRERISKKA